MSAEASLVDLIDSLLLLRGVEEVSEMPWSNMMLSGPERCS